MLNCLKMLILAFVKLSFFKLCISVHYCHDNFDNVSLDFYLHVCMRKDGHG